jgi:hypothetical protein
MKTPQERRRIIGIINEGITEGMNLKAMVSWSMLSLEEARSYKSYMTPERQQDVNNTHAGLNGMITEGKFEVIDFDALFDGFDETVSWEDEGF